MPTRAPEKMVNSENNMRNGYQKSNHKKCRDGFDKHMKKSHREGRRVKQTIKKKSVSWGDVDVWIIPSKTAKIVKVSIPKKEGETIKLKNKFEILGTQNSDVPTVDNAESSGNDKEHKSDNSDRNSKRVKFNEVAICKDMKTGRVSYNKLKSDDGRKMTRQGLTANKDDSRYNRRRIEREVNGTRKSPERASEGRRNDGRVIMDSGRKMSSENGKSDLRFLTTKQTNKCSLGLGYNNKSLEFSDKVKKAMPPEKSKATFSCLVGDCQKKLKSRGGIIRHVEKDHPEQVGEKELEKSYIQVVGEPLAASSSKLAESEEDSEEEQLSPNLLNEEDEKEKTEENVDESAWSGDASSFLSNLNLTQIQKDAEMTKKEDKGARSKKLRSMSEGGHDKEEGTKTVKKRSVNMRQAENESEGEEESLEKRARQEERGEEFQVTQEDMFDEESFMQELGVDAADVTGKGLCDIWEWARNQKKRNLELQSDNQDLLQQIEKHEGDHSNWVKNEEEYIKLLDKKEKEKNVLEETVKALKAEPGGDRELKELRAFKAAAVNKIARIVGERDAAMKETEKMKELKESVMSEKESKEALIKRLMEEVSALEGKAKNLTAQIICKKVGCRRAEEGCGKSHEATSQARNLPHVDPQPCYYYHYVGKCRDGEICSKYHDDMPTDERGIRRHKMFMTKFRLLDKGKNELEKQKKKMSKEKRKKSFSESMVSNVEETSGESLMDVEETEEEEDVSFKVVPHINPGIQVNKERYQEIKPVIKPILKNNKEKARKEKLAGRKGAGKKNGTGGESFESFEDNSTFEAGNLEVLDISEINPHPIGRKQERQARPVSRRRKSEQREKQRRPSSSPAKLARERRDNSRGGNRDGRERIRGNEEEPRARQQLKYEDLPVRRVEPPRRERSWERGRSRERQDRRERDRERETIEMREIKERRKEEEDRAERRKQKQEEEDERRRTRERRDRETEKERERERRQYEEKREKDYPPLQHRRTGNEREEVRAAGLPPPQIFQGRSSQKDQAKTMNEIQRTRAYREEVGRNGFQERDWKEERDNRWDNSRKRGSSRRY